MAKAADVAVAILDRTGPIDTYSLQKLLYYCQAWHLAWYDQPIFEDTIEAWAAGPVVDAVYQQHKGRYRVSSSDISGDGAVLTEDQAAALTAVVSRYSTIRGGELSDMTHKEGPWQVTRTGLPPGAGSRRQIERATMRDYYRNYGDSRMESVEAPEEVVRATAEGESEALLKYLLSVEP